MPMEMIGLDGAKGIKLIIVLPIFLENNWVASKQTNKPDSYFIL